MLQQETGPARTALTALLQGRLVFTPGPEDYTFAGDGTVAPIITGLVPRGRGARTWTTPPALRRALHHRDRGCRFPGCGVRFGEGHHIRHWAQRDPTTLSNLALLCRRHHPAVHEEGYHVDRQADGELRFRRPDGRPPPEVLRPPEVPGDPVKILRARHEAEGLVLHARTATPGWLGERLDVGWAIDVLHPLAAGPPAIPGRRAVGPGLTATSDPCEDRARESKPLADAVVVVVVPLRAAPVRHARARA